MTGFVKCGRGISAATARAPSRVLPMLVLLVPALFMSGCFAPRFKPPGDSIPAVDASRVCSEAQSHHAPVASMRALVDATVSRSDESVSFRYVIVGRGKDRFRIDMLPLEGAFTLGILVVRDGQTLLLDAQEKTFSKASKEAELLETFLGLEGITREVIVGLVTGVLPSIDCSSMRAYRGRDGTLSMVDRSSQVVWHVNPHTFAVNGLEILDRDGRRVQVSGERTAAPRTGLSAVYLSIFKPLEARVEMLVTKLSIDPPLADSLFAVAVPPSYTER